MPCDVLRSVRYKDLASASMFLARFARKHPLLIQRNASASGRRFSTQSRSNDDTFKFVKLDDGHPASTKSKLHSTQSRNTAQTKSKSSSLSSSEPSSASSSSSFSRPVSRTYVHSYSPPQVHPSYSSPPCRHANDALSTKAWTPEYPPDGPFSEPTRIQKLYFLGTASGAPSPPHRNTSSLAVMLSSGSCILLDCGEATQHQMHRSKMVVPSNVDCICVTHLHGDHVFGIFSMLCAIAATERTDPLLVVGPKGIRTMIETVLRHSVSWLSYPLEFLELDEESTIHSPTYYILSRQENKRFSGVKLTIRPISHRVPSFAYIIQEVDRFGPLRNVDDAVTKGARGKQLQELKEGRDVTLGDGTTLYSSSYTSPVEKGLKIALLQDTYDSTYATSACMDTDILIHEATYHNEFEDKAINNGHSTAGMAGAFAARCRARMLILTHFSNRYHISKTDKSPAAQQKKLEAENYDDSEEQVSQLIHDAIDGHKKVAATSNFTFQGELPVSAATDFAEFEINKHAEVTLKRNKR